MDERDLAEIFARLGAPDPSVWAASEIAEDIAQLARFVFLKGAWEGVIDTDDTSWMDRVIAQTPAESDAPFARTAHALGRPLEHGADPPGGFPS